MSFLYSGLMRVAAWVKAEFFRPDDGGGEDGELADVGGNSEQHPGRGEMTPPPHLEPEFNLILGCMMLLNFILRNY